MLIYSNKCFSLVPRFVQKRKTTKNNLPWDSNLKIISTFPVETRSLRTKINSFRFCVFSLIAIFSEIYRHLMWFPFFFAWLIRKSLFHKLVSATALLNIPSDIIDYHGRLRSRRHDPVNCENEVDERSRVIARCRKIIACNDRRKSYSRQATFVPFAIGNFATVSFPSFAAAHNHCQLSYVQSKRSFDDITWHRFWWTEKMCCPSCSLSIAFNFTMPIASIDYLFARIAIIDCAKV